MKPATAAMTPVNSDVHVGRAVVPFAKSCTTHGGTHHPAGWVLPGGRRVTRRDDATQAAQRINALISQHAA